MKVKFFLLVLVVTLTSACESANIDLAKQKLKDWGAPTDEVSEVAQSEWDKFFGVEYKIERLSASAPSTEIQEMLNTIGKDRWDCFHIERRGEELLIFCKRLPKSYLRYLSRAL